jgi:hypothetical protein
MFHCLHRKIKNSLTFYQFCTIFFCSPHEQFTLFVNRKEKTMENFPFTLEVQIEKVPEGVTVFLQELRRMIDGEKVLENTHPLLNKRSRTGAMVSLELGFAEASTLLEKAMEGELHVTVKRVENLIGVIIANDRQWRRSVWFDADGNPR